MKPQIVVAGHICLDIFPTFVESSAMREFRPGALYNVGPALRSTGGAVANTGLALHRLGLPVALSGKIGDDLFGGDILRIVRSHGQSLADGMKISADEASSYTVVISPPGVDRTFLHCPGCNDTYRADDVREDLLRDARLMHFGYPPLMRSMYSDGGEELARLLERAKSLGAGTSLDMAFPDPASPAGQVNWVTLLGRVLPQVDIFTPSIEEILFMIERPTWDRLMQKGRIDIARDITLEMLRRLAGGLIDSGCAIAMIKLGDQGAYVRSTKDSERIAAMGRLAPRDAARWAEQEVCVPCYAANFVGTTGSGDCTIAGFLTGLLGGENIDDALRLAVAVGACSVETADATSGIPALQKVRNRVSSGWRCEESALASRIE